MEVVGRRKRRSKGSRTHRRRVIGRMTRGIGYAWIVWGMERVIRRRRRKTGEGRKLREIEGIDAPLLKAVRVHRTGCRILPTGGVWIDGMIHGRPRSARCWSVLCNLKGWGHAAI